MIMQGQNVYIKVYRYTQLADDVAGGARQSSYVEIATGRARIQGRLATIEMRAQGLGADNLFDAAVTPATTDVQRDDMIIPQDGPEANVRFLVTSVQKPGFNLSSPRAHLNLQLERWDEGRMIDIL
jgi:hypothetical protein